MTDTTFLTSQVTSITQSAAGNTAHAANVGMQPAQTRMFMNLMQAPRENASFQTTSGAYSDMTTDQTTRFGETRSFEEIRHSMLASFDIHDPIGSMFAMTSDAMEAQMLFTRLHISTSLASAATSLFGNLLKAQQ